MDSPLHRNWKLLLRDVAASSDSAVHRVHAVSFDAAVASIVSAACCAAAGYFIEFCDYVSAGPGLVPADKDQSADLDAI
ncbi:hypothetical protein Tco_1569455 [Tanacetum coccineum]